MWESGYANIVITVAFVVMAIGNFILYKLVNFDILSGAKMTETLILLATFLGVLLLSTVIVGRVGEPARSGVPAGGSRQ